MTFILQGHIFLRCLFLKKITNALNRERVCQAKADSDGGSGEDPDGSGTKVMSVADQPLLHTVVSCLTGFFFTCREKTANSKCLSRPGGAPR